MTNNYYQKHKEKLKKKHAKDNKIFLKKKKKCEKRLKKDIIFSKEENEGKRQYHFERNKNLSEEQKQKLVEYVRNYYLAHKK